MQWLLMALGLAMMLWVRLRRVKRVWRRVATFGGTFVLIVGILYQPIIWGIRDVDLTIDHATISVDSENPSRAEVSVDGRMSQRFGVPTSYRIVLYVRSGLDRFTELSPALEASSTWTWRGVVVLDPPYDPDEIHVAIARLLPTSDVGTDSPAYRVESMPALLVPRE